MPTPIDSGDKADFIAIVNAASNILPYAAIIAERLATALNDYEDVILALTWPYMLPAVTQYNSFLLELMNTLDDTELQNVGIYVSKTSNSPVSAPNVIINSTYSGGINYTSSPPNIYAQLLILGNTHINALTLAGGMILQNTWVGSGSVVDFIDSTATGALFENIFIKFYRSVPASIGAAKIGSKIGALAVDEGSYFGGYRGYNPDASCSAPVTGLTVGNITDKSVQLVWTPPASGIIAVDVYYKNMDSNIWKRADDTTGDFINNTGYVFSSLEENTYYNFKVVTTCINGGTADTSVIVGKTICCDGPSSPL